ncbi:hypothetical protein [Pseudanabaena minima]|uniref:hypothetical protein n=1 Tax=Pseudanabaena minima TaxID=890415 RepID=UPI003DA9659A
MVITLLFLTIIMFTNPAFYFLSGSSKKERIYGGKDGRREAPPILTYLALPFK